MIKRSIAGRRSLSLLMVAVTTLTVALSGCSSKKAGDSAGSAANNASVSTADGSDTASETAAQTDAGDLSEIIVGIPQDIDNLDPHYATGAGTKEVLFNLFEGLVKPDKDGNLIPAVASEYTVSEDNKTFSFTLRDGIKFHDGSLVTVEDIKYSIERNAGMDGSEPLISAFSNIEAVNIVDDAHVDVVLKESDSDFLSYMTVAIIPQNNSTPETTPIGTGPYKFVSRSPQENMVATRFDEYWGDKAYIKDVTFKVEANSDAIVMDLEGGSIDMYARVTSTQASQLSDQFEIYEGTMNLVQALYLNNAVEPFNDVKVRQALCYAIDPQEIMDFVSDGKGAEIGSAMYPAFTKYFVPELNDTYNTDYDKAKELLTEAGYPDGFEFTITVASNYPQHVDTAQVLAQELQNIGVTANIQEVEWNSWLSDVYHDKKYEATVVGVDASVLTASALLGRYNSDGHGNFMNFSSADYDAAYAKAHNASNEEEKTALYKECETILSKEAASVYIQDLPEFVALNKKFTGYEFYPLYVQDIAKIRPAE